MPHPPAHHLLKFQRRETTPSLQSPRRPPIHLQLKTHHCQQSTPSVKPRLIASHSPAAPSAADFFKFTDYLFGAGSESWRRRTTSHGELKKLEDSFFSDSTPVTASAEKDVGMKQI